MREGASNLPRILPRRKTSPYGRSSYRLITELMPMNVDGARREIEQIVSQMKGDPKRLPWQQAICAVIFHPSGSQESAADGPGVSIVKFKRNLSSGKAAIGQSFGRLINV